MKNLPVIILGAGGHARVLIDCLLLNSVKILGMTDTNQKKSTVLGVPLLGNDSIIEQYSPKNIQLINGIGSISQPYLRRKIYEKFKDLGFSFQNVIHPSAVIATDVNWGEGAQVMAGAVIQSGCTISDNTIVNTSTSLDHECEIGAHVHLAPGVVLSGNVFIEELCHIGIGATIMQSIRVGKGSFVKAGTIVKSDIDSSL
jgi:sugar O-acyltransferase (sialic acid O-acetyltransferase NeuD family)